MTDDVQKILDAISLSQDYTLALYGDEGAFTRLKEKADLPESVKKFIAEKSKPAPKEGLQRENYKTDVEFAKAILEAEAAKGKAKEDEYKALLEKVKADIQPEIGVAVKKSLAPDNRTSGVAEKPVDFKATLAQLEGEVRFSDFMREDD